MVGRTGAGAMPRSLPDVLAMRRVIGLAAVVLTAVLSVSCGGGDAGTDASTTEASPNGRAKALGVPDGPIPSDADTKGMWSSVTAWPLIPLHVVLLPDGRVMSYGTGTLVPNNPGKQTGKFIYDVWDPGVGLPGEHLTINKDSLSDIFCSSQLLLPGSGAVAIAGGDNWTGTGTTNTGNNSSNIFTPATNTMVAGNNMNRPRWYGSSLTLLNGETYIQGGTGGEDFPEVRDSAGNFRLLTGASTSTLAYFYPRNFIAPDGRLFGFDANGRMYYVDPTGTGSISLQSTFGSAYRGGDSSAAMFRPGRIISFGGNSNGAIVIDIRGTTPTWAPTGSLAAQRRLVSATILADGQVLATGGSVTYNALADASYTADIWNPDTGAWTQGATAVKARLYHSMALLMPDATVLVGGGGAPGPQTNTNIEVYYPPYLFAAGGRLAERPVIDVAPDVVDIGQTFHLQTSGAGPVSRVVMVKTGSATHGWNMEQRFIELAFTADGSQLSVQSPLHAAEAPPGFYMVFVLNAAGVPSQAKIMRVNIAAQPNPSVTPSVTYPGDQANLFGDAVSLQIAATDPNGDVLSYSATGLPAGLTIDAQTGRIEGQVSAAAGTFDVTVNVSDGMNTASTSFSWGVSEAPPMVLDVPPASPPAQTGSGVDFTAHATGINVVYKWNFGDGSPETGYSNSPAANHVYSAPGVYYVTVTANDDRNIERRQTFVQVVHFALTATKPAVSSNILIEPRSGGGDRLWVVNQDNDSVSVFDAASGAKLAEVTVGAGPRTLALTPNATVWVTNKFGASISVIDTASFAVTRTIALPRGSQPFGVAMAPAGGYGLVALEGSGSLLKFDTTSYAQLASLAVGNNPRHVSITADGATAYVSRFITPPLPGEGTASVDTTNAGGEVVMVGTSSMSVLRTVLLAHSDKPDFENQGRGIPNYLGAAVLSPDGTQAWVPSKQDNIKRGTRRDGESLNFQSTVRAISSRIDLANSREDLAARIDHDNASVASAAAFDPNGVYLFVALETSREIAVVDSYGRRELFRFDVGLAPQGVAVAPDGSRLYVSNFMDRTVGVYDLQALMSRGSVEVPLLMTLNAIAADKLSPNVLLGKQLFYDARDTRLARDRYMSCATCHNDGGQDGRVWDLSSQGEGLRNTINLRGRAGAMGLLHWSANFDEVQDFEGQIRTLAGGSGLMSDAQFDAGTRSQPLGDRKAGLSAELDALAAYLGSLDRFEPSPARNADGSMSAAAVAGRLTFQIKNCAQCHAGTAFSGSGDASAVKNIGTIKATSGNRLDGPLTGIDIPTLRDVWSTAPYLHDGSAATLEAAIMAHVNVTTTAGDRTSLAAYLREIGSDEAGAPAFDVGVGLTGDYFNNRTLSGAATLRRIETVDFNWASGSPAPGIGRDNFSVRWTGTVLATQNGSYRFQTVSDDGVRLWVNGVKVIDRWNDHSARTDTSGIVTFVAGQKYTIKLEYYERGGSSQIRLRWRMPDSSVYVAIPPANLFAQ